MRFQYRATGPIAAAVVVALLAGCSRTQHDWRAAQAAGTAAAYQAFATRHPGSELASVARQRVVQLTEEAAWRRATRENSVAAYQGYLARYPNGAWAQDARIRMESRSLDSTAPPPASIRTPTTDRTPASAPGQPAAVPSEFADAAPGTHVDSGHAAGGGMPARQPNFAPAPSPSGDARPYAVQLGAYSSSANADAAWTRLAAKLRPELRGRTPHVVPVAVSGRRLYRLELSVADRAAARRLCRQIQQRAQDCLPVP